MNILYKFLLLIGIGVFLLPKNSFADWPTFRYDSHHTGASPYSLGTLSPIKWQSPDIGTVKSPPAVSSDGYIYISTANGLTKIDPASGQKTWVLDDAYYPSGTPAIGNDGNIYFANSGCNPYVYSITPNKTILWEYDLRQDSGLCGWDAANAAVSFSADKNTLYVGSDYPAHKLIAFNLDGTIKWEGSLYGKSPDKSSAVESGDQVYIGTWGEGRLYALSTATGNLKWIKSFGSARPIYTQTPLVGPDGNIYIATYGVSSGEFVASFDPSGNRRWVYQSIGNLYSGEPAIKDSTLYFAAGNTLHALDIANGTVSWIWTPPSGSTLTSPIVDKNGIIYTSTSDTIYSINSGGTTKDSFYIGTILGPPILASDGLIYISRNEPGTDRGWLYSLGQTAPSPTPTPTPPPSLNPVIFIPGIGGSEFKTNQDVIWSKDNGHGGTFSLAYPGGEKVWVNETEAALPGEDDYFDVLKLKPDGITSEADLTLTGNLTPFGYPDIDSFFEGIGYQKGINFFVFTYDWRKDIRSTKDSLDNLVEEAKQKSGKSQVNIVAHSMGGLVARNYIADTGKASKVNKLIELGVPHLGAPLSLKTLMYGTWLAKDYFLFKLGISPSEVKDIFQNLPGGFQLLPSNTYFQFYNNTLNNPYPFDDNRDIDSNKVTGSLNFSQIKTLLSNLNYNTTTFGLAENFHSYLDPLLNQGSPVKLYEISGSNQPTLGQIRETWWITWPVNLIPKYDEIYINGDNTVPLYSASLKSDTVDLSNGAKLYYVEQKHSDLVTSSGPAMQAVKTILMEGDSLPVEVKDQKITLEGQQVSVDQDGNLDLYDESGNHTGLKPDGTIETNIPNTFYDSLVTSKHVFIKKSAPKVTVKVTSHKTIQANIKIRNYSSDTINKTSFYQNIPVADTSTAQILIDPNTSNSPNISIDSQIFSPTSEATGGASLDNTSPTTTITLTGNEDLTGSYTGNVTVTLNSTDSESGILQTEYSLDNGQTVQTYTEPFIISGSGTTTLQVISTDKLGNQESPQTANITIHSQSSGSQGEALPDSESSTPLSNILSAPPYISQVLGAKTTTPFSPLGELTTPIYATFSLPSTPKKDTPLWLLFAPPIFLVLNPNLIGLSGVFLRRIRFRKQID